MIGTVITTLIVMGVIHILIKVSQILNTRDTKDKKDS